jgi:hypothetical protein
MTERLLELALVMTPTRVARARDHVEQTRTADAAVEVEVQLGEGHAAV